MTTNEDIMKELGHIRGTLEQALKAQIHNDQECSEDRETLTKRVDRIDSKQSWMLGVSSAIMVGIGVIWTIVKESLK